MGAAGSQKAVFRRTVRLARRCGIAHEDAAGGRARAWRQMLADLGLAPAPALAALYVPGAGEPDVWPIVDSLGCALLPVLAEPGGALLPGVAWSVWRGGQALVRPNPRRPAQPPGPALGPEALERADLVVAAALAVDRAGTRLGHGSGWYDRALPFTRAGVPVVAAVFADEVLPAGALPREPHDVPVTGALTERGWMRLGG